MENLSKLPRLSIANLPLIKSDNLTLPEPAVFSLPEKVLQFGTGVLLRGLPDYFIDKANRQGIFNGRVVMIKSTAGGAGAAFDEQDNLYTIYSEGITNGKNVNEQVVCSAISRTLTAATQWKDILAVAKSADLELVISNTTEVGIVFVAELIGGRVPESFPGKLTAVLYERFKAFSGSSESGLVIVPTELITDNGKKLKEIVLQLAQHNSLEAAFIDWINQHNHFCNSLVDRIVPGRPEKSKEAELTAERGYTDELNIMSEVYSLWAIEGDEQIAQKLSFSKADSGVVITQDIGLFRELKLRLLNATHTLSCAHAITSGFTTVVEAMNDEAFLDFITKLVFTEIKPSIPYQVNADVATDFANKVLDRFRNPAIRHEWLSISLHYTTKLKARVVPLIIGYYDKYNSVPPAIAQGLAAYLRFMRVTAQPDGRYQGSINGESYFVTDNYSSYFADAWSQTTDTVALVTNVLSNIELWDTDLNALPGLGDAIANELSKITD